MARKKLWSIFTEDMDHCMYTGEYGVERHHIFHYNKREKDLSEKYGFVAPLKPSMHPNGVNRTKEANGIESDLKTRCREYYLEYYGSESDFRNDFFKGS